MILSDEGLKELLDTVDNYNMSLFHIEFDRTKFGIELGSELLATSRLNKRIY